MWYSAIAYISVILSILSLLNSGWAPDAAWVKSKHGLMEGTRPQGGA
jgi:hypothetical protein